MDAQQSTSTIECITNLSDENPQILQYCQIIPDDYDKNDIVYITYDTETDENSLFKLEEDNVEILKVDNGESIQIFQNEHMQEALQEENEGQLIDVSNLKPVALIDGTKAFIAQNSPEIIKASEIPEGTMLLQDCTEILKTESSDDQFIEESIAIENDDSGKTFQLLGKNFQQVQLEDGTFAIIEIHLFDSNNPERILPDDNEDNENTIALYETKKPSKKNKLYLCTHEGCNKAYTTFHHLKVHDRSHTGIRPYQCRDPGCGKAFATSYSLKTHLRTHSGEKPYACTVCPKRFKTSGDLHKHTRIHTGERPFHCLIEGCNMSFTTSNIRKVHMRTHTGERPFHCPEKGCGKAFSSATNYKNHLRVHSGEKPYMCKEPNCGKRFTEYSSLYKHQLVHSQENHNVCNLCGKNYRQVSTLRSHKRTVHGIKNETDVILTGVVDEQIKNDINLSNPDSPVQFTLLKTNGDHQDINNDIDDENVKQIQIGRICYINASNLNL